MIGEMRDYEMVIDFIWCIQIIMTFATPFVKDVEVKDKCTQVAAKYLKGFFFLDCASTFFTLFTYYEVGDFYYLKALRILYFL